VTFRVRLPAWEYKVAVNLAIACALGSTRGGNYNVPFYRESRSTDPNLNANPVLSCEVATAHGGGRGSVTT